jgi:Lhr-like helicase
MAAAAALQRHWGFSAFRPGQLEVIAAVLEGRDALVVKATGSGKSIWYAQRPCGAQRVRAQRLKRGDAHVRARARAAALRSYQMPPLVSGKMCVVISPLIALMRDQARRGAALRHRLRQRRRRG